MDWLYQQAVGFLGQFFAMMGEMGASLLDLSWVQAVVLFFSYLGWALYGTGLVVAIFECGIECQSGRGSIKDTALNATKGFIAVSLFTIVPVRLYQLCVTLQGTFSTGLSGLMGTNGGINDMAVATLNSVNTLGLNSIMGIFLLIMMGYAIIKMFFANLKRGGILPIQIAVGSLYMFSVPRGYIDGFVSWCKQVIGLFLTAFQQSTILIAGLLVFKNNILLGLGLMLTSSEIYRIAGAFGLDTSTNGNLMSTVYTAQSAVNITEQLYRRWQNE